MTKPRPIRRTNRPLPRGSRGVRMNHRRGYAALHDYSEDDGAD